MRQLATLMIASLLFACEQIQPVAVPVPSEAQRQAVVVDIDGTLTPRVTAVFEARPGATEALNAFAGKGYKIVYLTARIPLFQANLPNWLQRNGFPEGSLHVAQTGQERAQVDQFKARILTAYLTRGWRVAYAYGDSSTDFEAYASAGIPEGHVFALRRKGAQKCQSGAYRLCLTGWLGHLPFIAREVPNAN